MPGISSTFFFSFFCFFLFVFFVFFFLYFPKNKQLFLENTVVQSKTNFKFYKWFIFKVVYFPKNALDAPVQGASFYVDKIKLASKLRELY